MESETVQTTAAFNKPKSSFFKDKNNKRFIKLLAVLLLLLLVVLGVLWARNAIETYKSAKKYKQSYDILQEQLQFCQTPKVTKNEDPTVLVHYCDELRKRASTIQLEDKK
jgi:hypothetical protein